jgi:hypothetical protein
MGLNPRKTKNFPKNVAAQCLDRTIECGGDTPRGIVVRLSSSTIRDDLSSLGVAEALQGDVRSAVLFANHARGSYV